MRWHAFLFASCTHQMTDNKYKCLVDAMANSELVLPPIKPDTEVEEIGRPSSVWDDKVHFFYQGVDGADNSVAAFHYSKETAGGQVESARGADHESSLYVLKNGLVDEPAESHVDRDTGKEVSARQSPLPGTVKGTIEKVFKCRDPKIS
jgi:hypothetical protein